MRKGLIAVAVILALLGGGGYFGLQYGRQLIADRIMDEMVGQVLRDGEMRRLLDDPDVRQALREAAADGDLERLRAGIGELPAGGAASAVEDAFAGEGGLGTGAGGDAGFDGAASAEAGGELPVRTVEEAEALVLEKFTIGEIRRYAEMLRGGLTEEEKRLIRDEALSRFTEEERRALLLVALIEAERRSGK